MMTDESDDPLLLKGDVCDYTECEYLGIQRTDSLRTDESDDPLLLKDGYHDDDETHSQIDTVMDDMPDTEEKVKPQISRGIMDFPVFTEIPLSIKSAAVMEKVKRWNRMQELAHN